MMTLTKDGLSDEMKNNIEDSLDFDTNKELKKAREEVTEVARIKDKIVSLVSHDLSNLHLSINDYIELLMDEKLGAEAAKRIVRVMAKSSKEMAALIKGITKLGEINLDKITPKPTFLNAKSVVERVLKSYVARAEEKGVTLLDQISPEARIYGDEVLLVEALQNLISNSIKLSVKGASIRIFSPESAPSTIAITDALTNAEASSLAESSLEGEGGVSDLRLSLSRSIIEAHNGDLIARHEVGKGHSFFVVLPNKKPTVLTVDDNELIRKMLIEYVTKLDVNITEVENGEEALGILESVDGDSPIDLVLLDLTLPGISGLEVLRRIKYNPENANIPVIVVTGDEAQETREEIFRMNADDIIIKPFEDKDVLPRLKRFLG